MSKIIQIIIIIFICLIFYVLNIILHGNKNDIFVNKEYGLFYSNQGWTDIFNTLSLIKYYYDKNIYTKIYIIVRNDGKQIVEFFIRDKHNIFIIDIDNSLCKGSSCDSDKMFKYCIENNKEITDKSDYLFHGQNDKFRNDKYMNNYIYFNIFKIIKSFKLSISPYDFVNLFYESYGINKNVRINDFIFTRDYDMEENEYNKFIKLNGTEYVVYHEFYKNINNLSVPFINLNQKTNIYFDYIKILENSKEIHVIDSSWGIFIYLLDAKYKLFQNKNITIYLYPKRNYLRMFQDPVKLDNWVFVSEPKSICVIS